MRSRRELDALRVDGLRATAGPLRLSALFDGPDLPPESRPKWRIAFSIPRSVGNAVVRNRARRRLRARFAEIVAAEPDLLPPGSYLVACRRAPRDSAEAHRWLISASRRLMAPSPER
ncbi:MAG: ribonuclease P protein component [Acidimicrobiales bacterium]